MPSDWMLQLAELDANMTFGTQYLHRSVAWMCNERQKYPKDMPRDGESQVTLVLYNVA